MQPARRALARRADRPKDTDDRQSRLRRRRPHLRPRGALAWWGLTRFTTDREYFGWQRQQLSPADLNQLLTQADRKRSGDSRNDISFYDLTAQPAVLPVLYSQRYDYYDTVGLRVMARVGSAARVLDFGCGVGILTTFYARQSPDRRAILVWGCPSV